MKAGHHDKVNRAKSGVKKHLQESINLYVNYNNI